MELIIAYAAGLLTLINPCVLPILPIVVAGSLQANKLGPAALALGMSVSFIFFGVTITAFGHLVGLDEQHIAQAGALLMILFGAVLLVPRFSAKFADARRPVRTRGVALYRTDPWRCHRPCKPRRKPALGNGDHDRVCNWRIDVDPWSWLWRTWFADAQSRHDAADRQRLTTVDGRWIHRGRFRHSLPRPSHDRSMGHPKFANLVDRLIGFSLRISHRSSS